MSLSALSGAPLAGAAAFSSVLSATSTFGIADPEIELTGERESAYTKAGGPLFFSQGPGGGGGSAGVKKSPAARFSERQLSIEERLANALFESEDLTHQELTKELDKAFEAHIARLDDKVTQIEQIVRTRKVPIGAAYPRYFEYAHKELMDRAHRVILELNDGSEVKWAYCAQHIVNHLKRSQQSREGIVIEKADGVQLKRGFSISGEIPRYSTFQLLCLLLQIRNNCVEESLVEQLQRTHNGRIIETNLAIEADVQPVEILRASALVGNVDIVHANFATVCDLAKRMKPDVDEAVISRVVGIAVAMLGVSTDSSRCEYDHDIARLKALMSDRSIEDVVVQFNNMLENGEFLLK